MSPYLKAFHGDPAIKEKYLLRLREHAAADEVIQRLFWEGGKGCAVGCTIHGSQHHAYETELGLPIWIAKLEDQLFEGMPLSAAKGFPLRFLDAIPVGANLQRVKWQFALMLQGENAERVTGLQIPEEFKNQILEAIEQVALVNRQAVESGVWDESSAKTAFARAVSSYSASMFSITTKKSAVMSAVSAARSAAYSVAALDSSGASYAADFADVVTWSNADLADEFASSIARSSGLAAASAAWSVAEYLSSRTWCAAQSAACDHYADRLIGLLQNA